MAARWFRPTVRARLTAAAAAVTIAMLTVGSVVILTVQRQALTSGVDEALKQRADNLAPLDPTRPLLPGEGDREDSFAQLLDPHGAVLAHTSNTAAAAVPGAISAGRPRSGVRTLGLDHPAGTFRVLMRPVRLAGRPATLVVGKNLDDVNESVRILTTTLIGVVPALALLLGALAWWLTGRTLRPVEAIRREVAGIDAAELHRRVPVPSTDDEVAELARTMNQMLARVQAARNRQEEFVDDASHELRTPLTRMVTDIDVALAHPGHEPPERTLDRLRADADELRQLLQDLLFLARSGRDGLPAEAEVDLDDIAVRVGQELRARGGVEVDTSGVHAARARGDSRELERAVRNLVDNAARHARSIVAISTAVGTDSCTVVVDDDGPGIAPANRERIFERFARLDYARGSGDGGAGLGLAIVADIATRHGGGVAVAESPQGGARLVFSVPRPADHSDRVQ